MNQELDEQKEMVADQYLAYKDWYVESNRYPRYLLTAALAFLAFSMTNFVINNDGNIVVNRRLLVASIISLLVSAIISWFTMFLSYLIFETGVRDYLAPITGRFGIHPLKNAEKVREMALWAWGLFIVSLLFFLLGTLLLVFFSIDSINSSGKVDCQTSYNQQQSFQETDRGYSVRK